MDAQELLKSWPGWSNAGMETILASPAWRMIVRRGGGAATLVRAPAAAYDAAAHRGAAAAESPDAAAAESPDAAAAESPDAAPAESPDAAAEAGEGAAGAAVCASASHADALALSVTFDGAPAALALADSPRYPDLHRLWSRRGALPPEIVLALVEKECGELFALLEAATRRQFAVVGLAAEPPRHPLAFEVRGEGAPFAFALELPAELLPVFGRLENLDPTHPAIRALTRLVWADYGTLDLSEAERTALRPGDFVLTGAPAAAGDAAAHTGAATPAASASALAGAHTALAASASALAGAPADTPAPRWVTERTADDAVHVLGAAAREVRFADFADGTLPAVPAAEAVDLVWKGRTFAAARPARVGDAAALRIEERK